MANFVYTHAKYLLLNGALDFQEAGDDLRVLLVMTNTSADTEEDVDTIDAFSQIDEYNGANYARQALASQTTTENETNNRGEFDATDSTFANLGAGVRQCQAAILYKHVTDDTDSIPIAYIDTGGFPFAGNGGNVVLGWNTGGILQTT